MDNPIPLIHGLTRRLRLLFVLLWALSLLLIVAGELFSSRLALYAGDARAAYYGETLVILLTALCVPLSLKLYAGVMTRRLPLVPADAQPAFYYRWNVIRFALLALPLFAGIALYYLLLSTTGLLCAAIALTASLFCIPGEGRTRRELHLDEPQAS
ncbi:MAG: hypothetical protein LBL78_03970 [Prevotellaceae bacterium]|jgi:hypothetical protein|nr:hypothetical protein [Prevotellaceae bacterium]